MKQNFSVRSLKVLTESDRRYNFVKKYGFTVLGMRKKFGDYIPIFHNELKCIIVDRRETEDA